MKPYHVQDSTGLLKLDAMENPYSLPVAILDEWLTVLRQAELNRYPDANASGLRDSLRDYLKLADGYELLLGNGSDELILLICLALAKPGSVLLSPEPGFAMYPVIARYTGMRYVGVPLNPLDFSLDMPAMLKAINESQPAVVFIANPNNPTGNLFSRDDLCSLIEASPGLVVIDEAYFSFSEQDCMVLMEQYSQVVILRTLSKVGLAGLRIGFLLGHCSWLDEINKVRLPYNINCLSQLSAEFILGHSDVLEQQSAAIRHDRDLLLAELQTIPTLEVWPSQTNFILFRIREQADGVFAALKQHGILIKNLNGGHPLLEDCLRVTVSTPEENSAFLNALRSILSVA